jgi:hypothetical protein
MGDVHGAERQLGFNPTLNKIIKKRKYAGYREFPEKKNKAADFHLK